MTARIFNVENLNFSKGGCTSQSSELLFESMLVILQREYFSREAGRQSSWSEVIAVASMRDQTFSVILTENVLWPMKLPFLQMGAWWIE